jgi:hypothetical protein
MAFHAAEAPYLQPEVERPWLLPERPLVGSSFEDGSKHNGAALDTGSRSPFDVYIPCWRPCPPVAWDFAVTSGLRVGLQPDAPFSLTV